MDNRNERRKKRKKKVAYRRMILLLTVLIVLIGAGGLLYHHTQMSITPVGDKKINIGLYGVYDEKGAKAVKNGKDMSKQVKIEGKVDTSKPGKYIIKYSADGITAKRTVIVGKKMNPVISLKDKDKEITMKLGEAFSEPGYSAKDENGKNLTEKVKVSYKALNHAGKGKISYTVEDSKGNKTRVYREVNIAANTAYDTPGLPICMYHYVYDEKNPPADLNQRFGNYISAQDLEKELNWLNEQGYYYPTWKEVRDYVDGKLLLPEKSIVLCFDDGAKSFLDNGIPVLEKCKVPATCFMITSSDGENKIAKYKSKYVYYESHSHNMHRPGGNIGHGGIFTAISEKDGLADLKKSIEICGSGDAFAYPYGDYNDSSVKMIKDSGFLCAMTTQPGKAKPGDNPLLLPRVRMVMGQSLDAFIGKVRP